MAQIRQSIDVNAPLHMVYNQWTQFNDFPRFMEGVREVRQIDDAHLHWRANRHGRELEWESEIVNQVPDQFIEWRDVSGPGNSGSITFKPLQADSTRVELNIDMAPHAISSTAAEEEKSSRLRIEQDLIRFKQMLELQGQESGAWRGEIHQAHVTPESTAPSAASTTSTTSTTQTASGATESAAQSAKGAQQSTQTSQDSQPQSQAQSQSQSQAWLPNLLQGWEEPVIMMRKMSDEMDQLFERFLGRPMAFRFGQGGAGGKWTPAIEIAQRDQKLVVCAELPGVRKEDVKIEIRQGKLILEGQRQAPVGQATPQGMRRSERNYGNFYRMIPLPEGVDPDQSSATMREGVLEITIPLPPQTVQQGRRIDIGPQ